MNRLRAELSELNKHYDYPHPTVDVARVRARNEAWTRSIGLCENEKEYKWFLKIDNALVSCMAYCREDESIAQLGADLITWLFLFDDKIGEGKFNSSSKELAARINPLHELCVTTNITDEECPFQMGLLDIIFRCQKIGGTAWRKKFARSIRIYFDGLIDEYEVRYEDHALDLEYYRRLRRKSIAAFPVFDLIDLKYGKVIDDPRIELLREKTADMLGWVNDLCSVPKEAQELDPINIASVMSNDYQLSKLDGFIAARDLIHDPDWKLWELRQQQILQADVPLEVKDYTHTLRKWVEATFHWSFTTRRYTDLQNDNLYSQAILRSDDGKNLGRES